MRWTPYVTVATVVERAGRFLMVEEDHGGPHTLFNPSRVGLACAMAFEVVAI